VISNIAEKKIKANKQAVHMKYAKLHRPVGKESLTHFQSMSLGTGAIKGLWGPWEPVLRAATNQHCHTEDT